VSDHDGVDIDVGVDVEDDDDELDVANLRDEADDDDLDDDLEDLDDEGTVGDVDVNAVPAANARAVLEYLVGCVVEDPHAVQVMVGEGRRGMSLDVRVGAGDMGRVIGKRGRVAQAIRTVVRAAAVKDGVSVDIEFVD